MPRLFSPAGFDIPTVNNKAALKVPTGSFEPDDLSGISAWYEADRITGLADGAAVVQWDDLSGNGYHLAHNDPTMRPTYQTSELNGLAVVSFDGTNDRVFNLTINRAQPETVFVVAKWRAVYSAASYVAGGSTSTAGLIGRRADNQVNLHAGSHACTVTTDTEVYTIYSAVFSGASSELRANGGTAATGNPGTTTAVGLSIGSRDGGSEAANVDVAAFLSYARVLTGTERARVESYLATKYAISLA